MFRKSNRDYFSKMVFTLDNLSLMTLSYFSTRWCHLVTKLWGVRLGKSAHFWGITHFKRHPGSLIEIGDGCRFRSSLRSNFIGLNHPCLISTHSDCAKIIIGEGCGFSAVSIGAYTSIEIGNNFLCGANTVITDFDWHINKVSPGKSYSEPILIEENVWIGMNCVILKGVHIGRNTIVGANSVVTRSLPENVVAAGSPAKPIYTLKNSTP